jgi:hypothetical protein
VAVDVLETALQQWEEGKNFLSCYRVLSVLVGGGSERLDEARNWVKEDCSADVTTMIRPGPAIM